MSKILIIDDDKALCYDLAETVTSWGHQVRTAVDGRQGFQVLDEWRRGIYQSVPGTLLTFQQRA